ncbi:MAG: MGMT family protein [Candidatus Omnitrophota bacterium]
MTPFAKKVYRAVLSIPLGQVRTYRWVAQKAGRSRAWRAVGAILHKNPFPVIIPCHRVIKSNNIPGGYNLGQKKKKALLGLEKEIALCLKNRK